MKLIINADDFGLCDDVNKSIIECYQKGNLTSTTLMVNMPGTLNAVDLASQNPGLGIGLHFSLTEGTPLTKNKSLIDENGNFLSRSELLQKLLFNKIDLAEVRLEFEAQLDKAYELGIEISHVDSHQHVHLIPKIFNTIISTINNKKLPYRNAVTILNDKLLFRNPIKYLKQLILKKNIIKHREKNSFSPDFMCSIYDFPEIEKNEVLYSNVIKSTDFFFDIKPESIVELIVHPYKESNQLKSLYPNDYNERMPFFQNCYSEYSILSSNTLNWKGCGANLVSFKDLV